MANFISRQRQIDILRMLVEGNSIRSTERLTGTHRDTIMRLLVRFGTDCESFHDLQLSHITIEHIQCDEIWTFVQKKQGNLKGKKERNNPEIGDIYLFTALCEETKLLASYKLGKRNEATTKAFVEDLERRLVRPPEGARIEDRPRFSTDGWSSYQTQIRNAFGSTARHGVLIKNYVNPEVGRYAPPELESATRRNIRGISDLDTICTSHVERHNLTIRTFIKRFTRLALGFSKSFRNLSAAVALHVTYHNFCWRPRFPGKTSRKRPTPAMAMGLVETLWDFETLFDAVMEHREEQRQHARMQRLIERFRRN